MFMRGFAMLAMALVIGMNGANAQRMTVPDTGLNYSPATKYKAPLILAGLWDKPNQACISKCEVFVQKGCFKRLSEKDPTADAGSIQDACEDKFSVCLYDCMCDTCDENQIIIKPPQQ